MRKVAERKNEQIRKEGKLVFENDKKNFNATASDVKQDEKIKKDNDKKGIEKADKGERDKKKSEDKEEIQNTSKRKKRKVIILVSVIVVVGILLATGGFLYKKGFFLSRFSVVMADGMTKKLTVEEMQEMLDSDKICEGIYINDIDVSNLTKEETKDIITRADSEKEILVVTNMVLRVDDETLKLDTSDLAYTSNIDDVIDKAYSVGRVAHNTSNGQELADALNEREQTKNNSKKFYIEYNLLSDGVDSIVRPLLEECNKDAVEPRMTKFSTTISNSFFEDSIPGRHLNIDKAVLDVTNAINNHVYDCDIVVETSLVEATYTIEGYKSQIVWASKASTKAKNDAARNNNIRLACEKIDGCILNPGEVFSFNEVVGPRTAANGFQKATVIQAGGGDGQDFGGGVCQVSSTLYQAVLKADLEIVARSPHSYPLSYAGNGLDATVDYGSGTDFKFKNDTDVPLAIHAYFDAPNVGIEIYGRGLDDGMTIDLVTQTTYKGETPGTDVVKSGSNVTARPKIVEHVDKVWKSASGAEVKRESVGNTTYPAIRGKSVAKSNPAPAAPAETPAEPESEGDE